ncbi:MAG: ComF family protein, partial [Acidobacteriota bacterium]
MAKDLQLPQRPLLGKHGQQRQVGTTRIQRLKQLRGCMYLRPGAAAKGQRVLVVDDVVTTGATMV